MERRKFLVLGGSVTLPVISGCSGSDNGASEGPEETPTDSPTEENPDTDRQDSPDESTPQDHPLEQFHTENLDSVEEYPDYASQPTSERLVPYERVESSDVPIYLEPSNKSLTKDETITFTLVNDLDEPFESGFHHWQLHKRVDDTWFNVKLSPAKDVLHTLNPGESHTWTLDPSHETAENLEMIDTLQPGALQGSLGQWSERVVVPGLGGGQYAFGITGRKRGDSSDEQIALVATFDLEAEPVELTPTEPLQEVQEDGDTVTAVTEPSHPDAELEPPKIYQVDRLQSSPATATSLITEQLWRNPPFWDTVALLQNHTVDRAVLTERDGLRYNGIFSILQAGDSCEDGIYEYDGEFYDVRVSEAE
jgi:hypothetical protein